jgi:hypothetical protein
VDPQVGISRRLDKRNRRLRGCCGSSGKDREEARQEDQEAAASEIDEVFVDPQVGISRRLYKSNRRLQPQILMRSLWILR